MALMYCRHLLFNGHKQSLLLCSWAEGSMGAGTDLTELRSERIVQLLLNPPEQAREVQNALSRASGTSGNTEVRHSAPTPQNCCMSSARKNNVVPWM